MERDAIMSKVASNEYPAALTRRQMLAVGGVAIGAGVVGGSCANAAAVIAEDREATADGERPRFRYCLNTSTIRGEGLGIVEKVEIAAQAGYDAIEPWIREIEEYTKSGGTLPDLQKRIADAGLTVDSAIGFAPWIVDDDERRRQGLEQAKREMDLLRQIGGARIAAPPAGATEQSDLNLFRAAERYRALLEAGRSIGVTPQLEVWGFSKSLARLGEVAFVAIESGDPDACVLPDVYHIYKGGSEFTGLKLLAGQAIHVFHMNDYPAAPPRSEINDSHRVYPGDGVAPLAEIIDMLVSIGFDGTLSLELFNREYWERDPLEVARTGLEKMKASTAGPR
jgi:sugar phosphate isomerase/epimerase